MFSLLDIVLMGVPYILITSFFTWGFLKVIKKDLVVIKEGRFIQEVKTSGLLLRILGYPFALWATYKFFEIFLLLTEEIFGVYLRDDGVWIFTITVLLISFCLILIPMKTDKHFQTEGNRIPYKV